MRWSVIQGTGQPPYKTGDTIQLNVTLYQSSQWDGSNPDVKPKGTHTARIAAISSHTMICTLNKTALSFYPAAKLWTTITWHILPW